MEDQFAEIRDHFLAALEHDGLEAQLQYARENCADNPGLHEKLVEMLRAHHQPEGFLASNVEPTHVSPLTEKPGTVIGPYKLLQQIGEGGFGVVYMAEQTEPVRRKVALKIIKPGMDTKEVIARFEAERQALALMDHPNIAKVLDAGATGEVKGQESRVKSGISLDPQPLTLGPAASRPYFVMELVKGVPVIEYCDKNHLSARDRLKLFIDICHAIQHAHQKGVIHRDLKPSNIMVTLHDGKPVPKVIDFGVSKALSQQLTEKTLFTAYGQMVGTPAYMSPEQAEMSGLDIDTRSDVYSLGVLLYELLTGSTPFDAKRLRTAGYAEMQRIIREEEPPKPSTRLTTLGEESTVVSSNRGTDPKKLGQLVRGDLDWIVMKALDKERNRRYETANGFAADIERFLADEPVEACPPSAAYRFRKFSRRNKGAMATSTLVVVSLIAGIVGTSWQAVRARRAERDAIAFAEDANEQAIRAREAESTAREAQTGAEEARDQEKALREEAQQQRERAGANFALARSAVDEFLNHVTDNELLSVPGMLTLRQELLSSALVFYDSFARDEKNSSEMLLEFANAHLRISQVRDELGEEAESRAALARAIEIYEQFREEDRDNIPVRQNLAGAYLEEDRYDETRAICREILSLDPEHAEARSILSSTHNEQGLAATDDNDTAAALAHHQQALKLREGLAREFPDNTVYLTELGATINNLGLLLVRQGKLREALTMFQEAVGYSAEAYAREPQTVLWGHWLAIQLRNMGRTQWLLGQPEEALSAYQRAVAIRRKLVFDNPAAPAMREYLYFDWMKLGDYQQKNGLSSEATRSFHAAREVLENMSRAPSDTFNLAITYACLATPPEGSRESLNTDQREELKRNADLAMETIIQAFEDGFRDVEKLESHELLAVLREREDFQQLVVRLRDDIQAGQVEANGPDANEQTPADRNDVADMLREFQGSNTAGTRLRRTLAAAQHTIGLVQIGLDEFDDAEQSLSDAVKLRDELVRLDPLDPELSLERLSSRLALGELAWARGELATAHARWEECLTNSAVVAAAFPESSMIRDGRLAAEENLIFARYGRLGLWPLLLNYAERTAGSRRSFLYGRNGIGDSQLAQGVLAAGDNDLTRRLLDRLAAFLGDLSEPQPMSEFVSSALVKCAAIADAQIAPVDQMTSIAQLSFGRHPDKSFLGFALAAAQYRGGEFAASLETVRPLRRQHLAFLEAAITERLGDHDGALRLWEEAENQYETLCADLLESAPPQNNFLTLAGWRHHWWHFATIQASRREASNVVHGRESPDPWQLLIQARGYHLIGEYEAAEADLAAAVAAAPEDPDVQLARTQLLEQWSQTEAVPDTERDRTEAEAVIEDHSGSDVLTAQPG